jgi:predicted DsbA family dithiol-disulfide isomerase
MGSKPGDPDRVIVYSDYVCPFCHLGREALKDALEDVDEAPPVEWRPFDLRGIQRREDGTLDESVDTGKDEAYFERVRQNLERLQERFGVEMVDLEDVEDVDSWNALRASVHVREEAPVRWEAFHDGLFRALWGEARDVGDPDVIRDVAEAAGLDGEAVAEAATDPATEEALRDRLEDARETGVQAVPTFLVGRRPIQGAAPPDKLREALETL